MLSDSVTFPAVRNVIVFASYNEAANLALLFEGLRLSLTENDVIVVADDSEQDQQFQISSLVESLNVLHPGMFYLSTATAKGGRGKAIRRGFEFATRKFPNAVNFLECDSDGSHSVVGILDLLHSPSKADLLIGSRYLQGSQIVGWTPSRRIMSKLLNISIPKILRIDAKDLTNGLRRYSRAAVDVLLSREPRNHGFIYLSQVAQYISQAGMPIEELPIRFEERVHGVSSVGFREIRDSLLGLVSLIRGNLGNSRDTNRHG